MTALRAPVCMSYTLNIRPREYVTAALVYGKCFNTFCYINTEGKCSWITSGSWFTLLHHVDLCDATQVIRLGRITCTR